MIRLRTRYRRDLTGEPGREKRRVEKLLESAGIKLSGVPADLHGVSGRDITEHRIAVGRHSEAVPFQMVHRAHGPRCERT